MSIEHVLAVVPVADFDTSHAWYEPLFGRPADNCQWKVASSNGD